MDILDDCWPSCATSKRRRWKQFEISRRASLSQKTRFEKNEQKIAAKRLKCLTIETHCCLIGKSTIIVDKSQQRRQMTQFRQILITELISNYISQKWSLLQILDKLQQRMTNRRLATITFQTALSLEISVLLFFFFKKIEYWNTVRTWLVDVDCCTAALLLLLSLRSSVLSSESSSFFPSTTKRKKRRQIRFIFQNTNDRHLISETLLRQPFEHYRYQT